MESDLVVANNASNTVSVFLAKDAQQISNFSSTTKIGNVFTFNATSTSGLPISYISSNPSILLISGNSATATGVGQVTVTGIQSGNTSWFGVTTTGVVTVVDKYPQTLTFGNFGYVTYGMSMPVPVTVSSGLPASFSVNGPAVIVGNTISFTGVGNVTVTAFQAGNSDFMPTSKSAIVYVYQSTQTLALSTIPYLTYTSVPFLLTATVSSGLPVSFTLSGPAAIAGGQVYVTGAGVVTITAFNAGNANYRPILAYRTFAINKASQTISFVPLPNTY